MPAQFDTIQPGQNIRCTVVKVPQTDDRISTILRLMRNDPEIKRGLKKAHRRRMQNLLVYNRGNRDWTSRVRVGKLARVEKDASWTMPYSPVLAKDFASVADYLRVENA